MPQVQGRYGMLYWMSWNVTHCWKCLRPGRDSTLGTMRTGEMVLPCLNRIKEPVLTLKSMNCNVEDKEIAMAALNGLPWSFEHPIVTLDAACNDDELFTFDFVKSWLLEEKQRSEMGEGKSVKNMQSSAFMPECLPRVIIALVCILQVLVVRQNVTVPNVLVIGIQPLRVGVQM